MKNPFLITFLFCQTIKESDLHTEYFVIVNNVK